MADGRHIAKCWKCYNSLIMTDLDETWAVAFHRVPNVAALMRLPW